LNVPQINNDTTDMTKNIFTTAIMAATFMLATAQIPFEVPTPSWQYLANPTSESGINIRKSPSATAPRMLYDETKIEYFYIPLIHYAYWSTATPKGSRNCCCNMLMSCRLRILLLYAVSDLYRMVVEQCLKSHFG